MSRTCPESLLANRRWLEKTSRRSTLPLRPMLERERVNAIGPATVKKLGRKAGLSQQGRRLHGGVQRTNCPSAWMLVQKDRGDTTADTSSVAIL